MLAFVTTQVQVDTLARDVAQATSGDAVVWFAYPKQSSKRYRCDFNRDTGWAALGTAGFEPVRQVAVDEDWSALRFRRVEFIKKLTRAEWFLFEKVLSDAAKRPGEGSDDPEVLLAASMRCLAKAWKAGHRGIENRVVLRALADYLRSLDEDDDDEP